MVYITKCCPDIIIINWTQKLLESESSCSKKKKNLFTRSLKPYTYITDVTQKHLFNLFLSDIFITILVTPRFLKSADNRMLAETSSTSKERFPNAFEKWKIWPEINKGKSKVLCLGKVHYRYEHKTDQQ